MPTAAAERADGSVFSPLNCKVMDSKKKPLWLTWSNADHCCPEEIFFMYKNGDGKNIMQTVIELYTRTVAIMKNSKMTKIRIIEIFK